jgi:hypothetical protein
MKEIQTKMKGAYHATQISPPPPTKKISKNLGQMALFQNARVSSARRPERADVSVLSPNFSLIPLEFTSAIFPVE